MRHRAIFKQEDFDEIISKCVVCHVSMVDENGLPYVLPMNFGYREGVLYLHSARQGKKLDILTQRPDVCVAFSTDYVLRYQNEEVACSWGMKYRSVLMYGKVEFIEVEGEKIDAMNVIMKKYTQREFPYNMPAIREVCIYRLVPARVTGRAYGY
ncbi:MAG: pyridoxamine 5'-phosphate oxidase family protein [Bacteroidetes bacterium]|nr:pyridoxamine 5'-phosphate oxidase family protein [Bacteroidota bacterium]